MHYPTPLGPYPIGDAKAHSASIQRASTFKPQLLLEGHGLSAYSEAHPGGACCTCRSSRRTPAIGSSWCSGAACGRMTISELLPEVMPIKTDLDYAVSTGMGMRRCYAEACIQTHLLWLIEQGKAERVREKGKIRFAATGAGDPQAEA